MSLASGIRFVNRNVDPDDDVTSYTPKIIDSTISNLALVRDNISHARVNQVVDNLIQAKRIYFFGLGASGPVAKDAENKFFRFNLPVSCHEDVLMQRMLASTVPPVMFSLLSPIQVVPRRLLRLQRLLEVMVQR